MKKILKSNAVLIGAILLSVPAISFAAGGIVGECSDCHTMHNSEQGKAVAKKGLTGTISETPNQNLLRMDCIACHAQDPNGPKIATLPGGSKVPQVYHDDTADLAGGNFKYITEGTSRRGHNVSDLFTTGDNNNDTFGSPPGKYYKDVHGNYFGGTATPFANFTCAGSVGCHGTRSQMLSGYTDSNITTVSGVTTDGTDFYVYNKRKGIPAISGAHHNSYDGMKSPDSSIMAAGVHDGTNIAKSYRFIKGLKGTGNTVDRWQNVSATSHNEYFGKASVPVAPAGESSCNACHSPGDAANGGNSRMTTNSTLKVPNQSMSGFCITCHGNFHSSATETGSGGRFDSNGASGAFLRHPSDYVIKNVGEYAAYTSYNITAPVARPTLPESAESTVNPGSDMVMCLSCHKAHATQYDAMLRFDYNTIIAGNSNHNDGCLACHTSKGILPENR